MNREEIDQLLAEYVGGELGGEALNRFERLMDADPALRAEARSLGEAVAAMRSLDATPAPAPKDMIGPFAAPRRAMLEESGAGAIDSSRRRVASLLRYAAVVIVAFTAGALWRGWSRSAGNPTSAPVADRVTPIDAEPARELPKTGRGNPETGVGGSDWRVRFARTYAASPNSSGLGRELAAWARTVRD